MICGGWFGSGCFFEGAVSAQEVGLEICDCVKDVLASVEYFFCRAVNTSRKQGFERIEDGYLRDHPRSTATEKYHLQDPMELQPH